MRNVALQHLHNAAVAAVWPAIREEVLSPGPTSSGPHDRTTPSANPGPGGTLAGAALPSPAAGGLCVLRASRLHSPEGPHVR